MTSYFLDTVTKLPKETQQELQEAVKKIRNYANPDLIILFGRYAQGEVRSCIDCYEIALITKEKSILKATDIQNQLMSTTKEIKSIFISLFNIEFINRNLKTNLFLNSIFNDGITLYDNQRCKLNLHIKLDIERAKNYTNKGTEECFQMAKTLLDNAEYNLRNKALRVVATNLHQAMQQLFFTVEYKYHGFRSNEYDLRTHYLNIIRHFSIELRLLFDLNVKENRDQCKNPVE